MSSPNAKLDLPAARIMRLPPIPPAELTAEQRQLYEDMKTGVSSKYSNEFRTMREDGAMLGRGTHGS